MKAHSVLNGRARGILLLIAAVVCFGVVDGLSKILIDTQSFGQVVLARYALALPALVLAWGPGNWKSLFQTRMAGLQIFRGLTPVIIGGLMIFAVHYLPLAEATVILFAGPFFVVALSGWMLREHVSGSSWIGVAVGFLAVLIVARPGLDELSRYTIFPALAALFYALFQLLTCRLGTAGEHPTTTLAWTLLIGNLVAIPLVISDWHALSLQGWFLVLCLSASFGLGQYFLAKAFALAPANILTPFSYFQILSAVAFGLIFFNDVPDRWTIVGIVLILAAGAYVFGQNAPSKTRAT